MKHTIKIRFNTECTDNRLYWRVLIDGAEHLAENVFINVPVFTSGDFLPEKNQIKHHISCESDILVWNGIILTVNCTQAEVFDFTFSSSNAISATSIIVFT